MASSIHKEDCIHFESSQQHPKDHGKNDENNEESIANNQPSIISSIASTQSQSQSSTISTIEKKKRLFSKELRCMMYGFGDDQNPFTETVDMLEDLVIYFIGYIALEALEIGRTGRVTVEDVMYLVRRDARKYSRVKDLLSMNEELKRARKAFDEVEYVQKKKKLSKQPGNIALKSLGLSNNSSNNENKNKD